jgi:hypothetical protein
MQFDQALKSTGICLALLIVLAPCVKAVEQKHIDSADRLFQSGEFANAGEQYARIAADHPTTTQQFFSWAGSHSCPTVLTMRRIG